MQTEPVTTDSTCNRRPRIALVADVPEWAFHNIASSVMTYLGSEFEFRLFHLKPYYPGLQNAVRDLFGVGFDLVHFFCREGILDLFAHCLRHRDAIPPELLAGFARTAVSFSIYDHCFLSTAELANYRMVFNGFANAYTVSSARLEKIYRDQPVLAPPFMVIEDGVDPDLFAPENLGRLAESDRELHIGWAGNSRWGMAADGRDHKGLQTLLKPAIGQLRDEGLPVVGQFADSSEARIPYRQMQGYYNALDLFVCCSDLEGTPNPVLEAMACGLPVVSTDVGIVPELFGPLQREFILSRRDQGELRDKLRQLCRDPELRQALSRENLERIQGWTRAAEAGKWRRFFAATLQQAAQAAAADAMVPGSPRLRAFCLELPMTYKFEQEVYRFLEDSWTWRILGPLRKLHFYVLRALRRR